MYCFRLDHALKRSGLVALKKSKFFQEVGSRFHQNFDRQQDSEEPFSEPFVDLAE